MLAFLIWALSDKGSKLSLSEQFMTTIALLAILLTVFPQVSVAQSVEIYSTLQQDLEIKHQIQNLENQVPIYPRDIPGTRIYKLRNYLVSKDSPLADHVEMLLLQPTWKLTLAISHAESNMCKRELGYNCWGIGGGNHRKYPSYNEAIADANAVIGRYVDNGHTPESMLPIYVGWDNPTWVIAVNNILDELERLEL